MVDSVHTKDIIISYKMQSNCNARYLHKFVAYISTIQGIYIYWVASLLHPLLRV